MPFSDVKNRLLQRYIRGGTAEVRERSRQITRRPDRALAPLSLSQEQLFLRETGTPGIPPLYNECIVLRLSGPLDVGVLECSLREIIRRHEIWRTSYDIIAGKPIQVVHPVAEETRVPIVDVRSSSPEQDDIEVQAIREIVRQPFDLKKGPLLRFRLIRTTEFEHRLFVVAHLSVVDGVSVYQVFPSELATLYTAYCSRRPSPLPDLKIQFGDYAYWQRNWLDGEEFNRQLSYWRNQLSRPLPFLNWPVGRPVPSTRTFRGAIRPFELAREISEAVRQLTLQEGVTLFTTLLSAFVALLHCYTRQDDIIVGTLSPAGRKRSEVAGLLGYFLNPIAVRFDLTGDPTFRELLRQAQKLILEAISNDDLPLEFLTREFCPEYGLSVNPFFNVAISLQPPMPELDFDWSVTSMDVESGGAPWDFYLAFIDMPTGIMGRVQYDPDLFGGETIVAMQQHLQRLLQQVSTNPVVRLSELELLEVGISSALGPTACHAGETEASSVPPQGRTQSA